MQRPGGRKKRPAAPTSTTADAGLLALGRDLSRLRRRCRRLRHTDWTRWSATVEEANALARQIGRMQPGGLDGLLVRYEALHWLLVEADDLIMDTAAKQAFVAFGRALRRLAAGPPL